MELRIFADSLGILEVPNIQQEVVLGQYMQGTDSVVGERRLSLIVHYRQEELTLQGALIVLIKGCTAQEEEVRKKIYKHTQSLGTFDSQRYELVLSCVKLSKALARLSSATSW